MNSTDTSDKSFKAPDLDTLFSDQKISIPDALDKDILSLSKQALEEPSHKGFWPNHSPWMATAAVVMLAVLITPLLLRAPENQLESNVPDTQSSASAQKRSVFESGSNIGLNEGPTVKKAIQGNTVIEESVHPKLIQQSATVKQVEDTAKISSDSLSFSESEHLSADRVENYPASDTIDIAADSGDINTEISVKAIAPAKPKMLSDSLPQPAYRSSAEQWLSEIKTLVQADKIQVAKDEYNLFLLAYPDHEHTPQFP